ncbi:MAG: hypothetical protein QM605_09390, partial [Sphingobium sp.]
MPKRIWLSIAEIASLCDISRQSAHAAVISGKWRGHDLNIRSVHGRGGKSGLRYEVLLSSLPEALQRAFKDDLEDAPTPTDIVPYAAPTKFIAALHQTAEEDRRYMVLRHILDTDPGTKERAQAVHDASHHSGEPVRTIYRWLKRLEEHGGDLDALGRKLPANAGRQRRLVSTRFDKAFRAAGYPDDQLAALGEWLTREIAGWWQSPVQRAGWVRVRL